MAARFDPFDTERSRRGLYCTSSSALRGRRGRFEGGIRRDPHNYIPYLMLGNLQLNELDDLDAAEESYRDVLRLNPQESTVREALGQVLIQQGD